MKRRRKKHTPFVELARHRQKDQFIGVRNKIRRAAPVLGGLFYTHDYMHGQNGWLDGYFLGPVPVFYNFALETAIHHFKEECMDLAWDEAEALVPHRFNLFDDAKKDPATGLYVCKPREPEVHPEFDGMTRIAWVVKRAGEIASEGKVSVFEEVTLHRDYRHGIGLHGTINVPFLTVDAVNEFIARFLEKGDGWRGEAALEFSAADVGHWGLESNAIVEPWEYPPSAD